MNLKIITSTTRPQRKGDAIANWIFTQSLQHKDINTELLNLSDINLPLMDEPNHPRLGQYQHEHTKSWSAKISSADAIVIVLGEYNYGFPAPIKNAIDYLFHEWKYKPVGIVSYGGVAGGTRATQMIKQVLTTLQMMPIAEGVTIPFFPKYFNPAGEFVGDEAQTKAATVMLGELHRWTTALKALRQ